MTTQKPRKDPSIFFPVRNGRTITPKEGVNYTVETLTYMTPPRTADEVTDAMIGYALSRKIKPVHIVEACGGLGGNTMSFLDNPNVDHVFTHEIRPERAAMLKNNLEAYGFAKDRYTIINGTFNGLPSGANRPFLYLDPPWLPPNIPGHMSRAHQYITSGIELNGKTVEDWLISMPNIRMSVTRFPPKYQFNTPPRWNCNQTDMGKHGVTVVCVPPVWKPAMVKARTIINDPGWIQSFRVYVHTNVATWIGIKNQLNRNKIVEVVPSRIWASALTHPSYDANPNKNYMKMRMIGQTSLKLAFYDYVTERYPGMDSDGMERLFLTYMSPAYKEVIAKRIQIYPLIRSAIDGDFGTDVIESLFGAIYSVGNRMIARGVGQALCVNFIGTLFNGIKMDTTDLTSSRSWIESAFAEMGWGNPSVVSRDLGYTIQTSIFPSNEFVDYVNSVGVSGVYSDDIMGTGSSRDLDESIALAYRSMRQRLESLSINDEWIEKAKSARFKPAVGPYYQKALQRASGSGYTKIYLSPSHETGNARYIQLIGVNDSGVKNVLETASDVSKSKTGLDLAIEVMMKYARVTTSTQVAAPVSTVRQDERVSRLMDTLNIAKSSYPNSFPLSSYLDLGCGDTTISSAISKAIGATKQYYADIEHRNVPDFVLVKDSKIPVFDNAVNLLTAFVSIHHYENMAGMFSEMLRVMKPGGFLFIREHDATINDQPPLDFMHLVEDAKHGAAITEVFQREYVANYVGRSILRQYLESIGFRHVADSDYPQGIPNPQRLYHSLFILVNKGAVNSSPMTVGSTEFTVRSNNLSVWLLSNYKNHYWLIRKIEKRLGVPTKRAIQILQSSKGDRDFFKSLLAAK